MGKKCCILFEKICYECGMIQIVRKARDWTNLRHLPPGVGRGMVYLTNLMLVMETT